MELKVIHVSKGVPGMSLWTHCQPIINHSIDYEEYRQVSNIRRTLAGKKIVDHSDVVGAVPTGDAPTTSSFST